MPRTGGKEKLLDPMNLLVNTGHFCNLVFMTGGKFDFSHFIVLLYQITSTIKVEFSYRKYLVHLTAGFWGTTAQK
jgi:hypothetical protein